jgi:AcrR family transcriptional regulator
VPRTPTGQNSRGIETRTRILDAAVGCLAEGGIDAVRVAKVAQLAGVSSALVHYHFSTREELLAQALESSFRIAGDVRSLNKYGSGTPLERLRSKLEESLPYPGRRQREWELWVELWLRAVREPALRTTATAVYRQLHGSWVRLLDEGAEAGLWVIDDARPAADRILALIDGYGLRALIEDPEIPVERAFDAVWADISGYLRPVSGN